MRRESGFTGRWECSIIAEKDNLERCYRMNIDLENKELGQVFLLFFDELPTRYEIKNTSRGEEDFREAVIAEWSSGEKFVLKLSDNDFTFPEKIKAWQRCAREYRKLGYYCPEILNSKNGDFPRVIYKGHNCVVYMEEFCKYTVAEERCVEASGEALKFEQKWDDAAWMMTAKMAAQYFDFCEYPSGYCLFETFCPSDKTDEVLENALEWKKYVDALSERFHEQTERIWKRWNDNRNELEKIYHKLPTSVFQADLNTTNLLLDENGEFVGVFDFNLCGRDVFLNYLFREIHYQYELQYLLDTLKKVSRVYSFSELEKQAAPLLYRCLVPLWYTEIETLKEAGQDESKIQACLNRTEELQTKEIDFAEYMSV